MAQRNEKKTAAKKTKAKKATPKKAAVKKTTVKKATKKTEKNVSGYGSGGVDVVMSVDQIAKEAASISASATKTGELEKLPATTPISASIIYALVMAKWKFYMTLICVLRRVSHYA